MDDCSNTDGEQFQHSIKWLAVTVWTGFPTQSWLWIWNTFFSKFKHVCKNFVSIPLLIRSKNLQFAVAINSKAIWVLPLFSKTMKTIFFHNCVWARIDNSSTFSQMHQRIGSLCPSGHFPQAYSKTKDSDSLLHSVQVCFFSMFADLTFLELPFEANHRNLSFYVSVLAQLTQYALVF